ncbi:MAG: hypothetical protein ABI565_04585, partial [Vicinamibacteria bacterium]
MFPGSFRTEFRLSISALAGFTLLALLFVWPLSANLTDQVTGDPAGDTGAYVWNAYVFSRNIASGSSLLHTDRVLSFAKEASLALHNNSLFLSALAAPLVPAIGVIAAFNVALVLILILNPFSAYLLARHETGTFGPAWLGGALFGFSPFISARIEGHMSLATAFALPLVVLFARRGLTRDRPSPWAFLPLGVSLALCAASDPYYLVFGVIVVALVWASEYAYLDPLPQARFKPLARLALIVAAVSGVALLWIHTLGGGEVRLGSARIGVRSSNTPVLALTIAALLLAFALRPRKPVLETGAVASLKFPLLAGAVAAVLLLPWLSLAASEVFSKGGTEAPLWRSSPRGVDLLSFFLPNPTHPWFREFIEPWMTQE